MTLSNTEYLCGERRALMRRSFLLSAVCAALLTAPAGCNKAPGRSIEEGSDADAAQVETSADSSAETGASGESDDRGQAAGGGQQGAQDVPAAASADSRSDAPPADRTFSAAQLEQMVAPLALHPDALLMQILMAATYPVEVVEADAWLKDHDDLKGEQLDAAVRGQNWEESVQSLTHFPQVLTQLAADQDWTEDLGDAFLAQKDDLLNAVQAMRSRACELGTLKTTAEQQVIIEPAPPAQPAPASPTVRVMPPPTRIVRIVPTAPGVIYVPVYSPRLVYGPPPPVIYYPRIMAYSPGYIAADTVISFGIGLSVGAALWGDLDWRSHDIYRNRYAGGYHGGRGGYDVSQREPWRHDSRHRRGAGYPSGYVTGGDYGQPGMQQGRPGNSSMAPGHSGAGNRYEDRAGKPPHGNAFGRGGPPPRGPEFGKHSGPPPRGNAPDRRGGPPSHGREFGKHAGPPPHGNAFERRGGPPSGSGSHGSKQRGNQKGDSKGKHK